MRYVPKEMVEEWARKDPIERQQRRVAELGVDVDALRAEVRETVDRATEEALAMPMPDPASATDGVFAQTAEALGDGRAPWSGFHGVNGAASARRAA
jgi:pyruvate dehydrogenase E1 component alpha subunit